MGITHCFMIKKGNLGGRPKFCRVSCFTVSIKVTVKGMLYRKIHGNCNIQTQGYASADADIGIVELA